MTTVLIVDDEPDVLDSLRMILELEGFDVRPALDADEALDELDGADLVLTDMSMPGATGLELLEEIRRRKPHLPIAMMTAHASVDVALKAMQAGAYDYLLKPYQAEEIILKVKLGLRLSRYEHELRARNEELERTQAELRELNTRLEAANVLLERLATTDALTGLANRRKLMERLDQELAKSRRYDERVSLVLLDVDHFKRINDRFGHPVGDRVLAELAELIQERARETDLAARIGGEEFAVLLSSTGREGATELAEDLRERVEAHAFEGVGRVTVSLGVATHVPEKRKAGDPPSSKLFAAADQALYRAKGEGRNRVRAA
ncbi:diguanylate cyclase [Myxococcota bacterium]|nr:diguanylate cyclase [Myxococcota bacterium]